MSKAETGMTIRSTQVRGVDRQGDQTYLLTFESPTSPSTDAFRSPYVNEILVGGPQGGAAPSGFYSTSFAHYPVTETDISLSNITYNNVTSSKHGLAPVSPADATKFLNGAATPAYAQVKDSDLSTSDITTNNVSTSKHGFAPKAPNDSTRYLDGTGNYSVPAGSGGSGALVLLEQHTASSSTSLNFTACLSSTYDEYAIEFVGVVPATNAAVLILRFSTDGGSTYDSTSGHYGWSTLGFSSASSGVNGSQSDTSIQFRAGITTGVAASGSLSGALKLAIASSLYTRAWGTLSFIGDTGFPAEGFVLSGAYLQTTAPNAFQVLMSTGNIASGIVRVYGIAKS